MTGAGASKSVRILRPVCDGMNEVPARVMKLGFNPEPEARTVVCDVFDKSLNHKGAWILLHCELKKA